MSWSSTEIDHHHHQQRQVVSNECIEALHALVQDNSTLAVATEASSHPSGLASLWAQPDTYAGGGLGNYNECGPLQYCLAGGVSRDSFTHAAACVPNECTAHDLDAKDYLVQLQRAVATTASSKDESRKTTYMTTDNVVAQDYYNLQAHIYEMNQLLRTGWTCGNFVVPWNVPWTIVYFCMISILVLLGIIGTKRGKESEEERVMDQQGYEEQEDKSHSSEEEKKENTVETLVRRFDPRFHGDKERTQLHQQDDNKFWSAWDVRVNYARIGMQRQDNTACLDGLRVGSILWIILGHVMAIESSAGAGYNDPKDFLPPHGITNTFGGQLLFASRFAVDTFLFISGFLVVRVLGKIPMSVPTVNRKRMWFLQKYISTLPGLLLHRVLRILPVYAVTLGFWIIVAPHLGGGPFWYKWLGLLKPCMDYGWTNLLFINNFVPSDLANTETCFYHSWYLAIDVQLFLIAPLLVYWYRQSPVGGRRAAFALTALSVAITFYLSYVRNWSINTFDGAAVARFDVEGYAKPHVRAQSYLSGILLAMCLGKSSTVGTTKPKLWHRIVMGLALLTLASVTFGTVTGAYSRRPCRYEEWPTLSECGSTWSPTATFWYAAAGRAAWSLAVAILVGLCLTGHGGMVGTILSWKVWTPLSQLSYGAYLVHPICLFVWQLSDTQKASFSVLSIAMNYVAVTVVSFVIAFVLALLVEFPCATLQKNYLGRKFLTSTQRAREQNYLPEWSETPRGSDAVPLVSKQGSELSDNVELYGTLSSQGKLNHIR